METAFNKSEGSKVTECISDSLSLFEKPYQETSIDRTFYSVYTPQNALSDTSNSIHFNIPMCEENLDLNESFYKVAVKITQKDGKNLEKFTAPGNDGKGNSVGLSNLGASSLFSNILIRVGSELISDSYSTYPFLCFFSVIFNYTKAARDSLLSIAGYQDEKQFANRADDAAPNSSFKTLASSTSESQTITLVSGIYHGLFNQSRYLPPLLPLSITFLKSENAFALTSNAATPEFKYEIVSLELHIKKIVLRSSVKLQQETRILKQPALFPIRSASVKPFFISKEAKSASFENIFPGNTIPNLVIVGFLPQSQFRGNWSSPFQFLDHSLTSLKITVDSQVYPTPNGYILDYATDSKKKDWSEAFLSLFYHQTKLNQERICNYDEYPKGHCLYTFSLGHEEPTASDHFSVKRLASGARLHCEFSSTSTNEALVCLIYSECQSMIEIDGDRRCTRDFYL